MILKLLTAAGFSMADETRHRKIEPEDAFCRLTVLLLVRKKGFDAQAVVECECGELRLVAAANLLNEQTKSCGCYFTSKMLGNTNTRTHNMTNTLIYGVWAGMKARCSNKLGRDYRLYGGRGIKLADSWNSFEVFFEDMSKGYFPHASIDRIDNDGDYCKDNCQWLTVSENAAKGSN